MKFFIQNRHLFFFMLLLTASNTTHGIITFFLKPYPYPADIDADNTTEIMKSMRNSGSMALKKFKNFIEKSHLNVGILATYGGYLAVSDFNGQIIFPHNTEEQNIRLLVTNRLVPIIMFANTIHHWEIEPEVPAEMYSIERKEDEETKLLYWEVAKVPLPEDRRIPLNTIIIIAKPKYVYVPIGATLTNTNPQLILPNIYIKQGITRLGNALYTLNIRHFFGPVRFSYKKDAASYEQHIAH